MEIQELDKNLVDRANSISFNGNRGNLSEKTYQSYINEVLSWNIPNNKKQKILEQVHKKYSEILKYEAQHVSVMVAGPAKYNSRKFDKSNQIFEKIHNFCEWFDDLRRQVSDLESDKDNKKIDCLLSNIESYLEKNWDIKESLEELAFLDNKKFIELYEKYYDTYKWKKSTNIYKIYQSSLKGEIKEIRKEIIFEDENFTAYIEGDRAYIKFPLKIQQQLKVALKHRKWWWNSYKKAWSTYLNRVDIDWIKSISEKYSKYL